MIVDLSQKKKKKICTNRLNNVDFPIPLSPVIETKVPPLISRDKFEITFLLGK